MPGKGLPHFKGKDGGIDGGYREEIMPMKYMAFADTGPLVIAGLPIGQV